MSKLSLGDDEAGLVYLACLYHLGRPGTEVDPVTRQPHAFGLTPVRAALEGRPAHGGITLEVSDYQLKLLGEALLGLVNELKQINLSGRSVMPGLVEAITRLYPDVTAEEPAGALDLSGEAAMLRRRLDAAVRSANAELERQRADAEAQRDAERRGRWRFWRR
ncbi:MAG: hypothetical protein IT299_13045 [Dehalococcoidia bacterium]|nr:hypothetical protein [Dehalococcoidia bacterium]